MTDVAHQRYLELSARIAGIEYLLKQVLWRQAEAFATAHNVDANHAIDAARQDAASSLQHAAFPGLDPSASDHVAAMAAEHVDRVLGELIEEMESE